MSTKYDWLKLKEEYLNSYYSLRQFRDIIEERAPQTGEPVPTYQVLKRYAHEDGWNKTRDKMREKAKKDLNDINDQNPEIIEIKKTLLEKQTRLTDALIKLVEWIMNNPEHVRMTADAAELINAAQRALGMATKETQQTTPMVNIDQRQIGLDSFRAQLENKTRPEIVKEAEYTIEEEKELERKIDDEELEFLDNE